MNTIYSIDPLRDERWPEFVERHSRASVFHSRGWLEALWRAYGYEPVVLTTTPPGSALKNGLVFCYVESWITGRRLVSLPFSDHCEPLLEEAQELHRLFSHVESVRKKHGWKYIEVRPLTALAQTHGFQVSETFCFHRLNLTRPSDELFHSFHKNCIQRKIRRAEREALTYEQGRSHLLLRKFYHLMFLTRRRHGLPPQPFSWFQNLAECLGNRFQIHLASKEDQPVASIITLSHRTTLYYKYGCSDTRFNNLGGVPFLFWKAIRAAKQDGLLEFDLGRCDLSNPGLITFKDRWGTDRSLLAYYRFPASTASRGSSAWTTKLASYVFEHMPDPVLMATGKFLYRHIA